MNRVNESLQNKACVNNSASWCELKSPKSDNNYWWDEILEFGGTDRKDSKLKGGGRTKGRRTWRKMSVEVDRVEKSK